MTLNRTARILVTVGIMVAGAACATLVKLNREAKGTPTRRDVAKASKAGPVYDPAPLSRYIGIRQIYDVEQRDPVGGAELEQRLGDQLLRDIKNLTLPIETTSVSCKRTACRVDWTSHDKNGGAAINALLSSLYPIASSKEQTEHSVFLLTPRYRVGGVSELVEKWRAGRRLALSTMRERKVNPFPSAKPESLVAVERDAP